MPNDSSNIFMHQAKVMNSDLDLQELKNCGVSQQKTVLNICGTDLST